MHDLKIVMEGPARGKIYLDDKEVEGVFSFELSAGVDKVSTIMLGLSVDKITFKGPISQTIVSGELPSDSTPC